MFKRLFGLGLVAGAALMATPSHAAISVQNASFESPSLSDGTDNFNNGIPSWTTDRNDVAVFNPNAAQFAGEGTLDGSNVIWLNFGIIHQDLGTMVAGETYTFDVTYGGRSDSAPVPSKFAFLLRPSISSPNAFLISHSAGFSEGYPTLNDPLENFVTPDATRGVMTDDIFSYTATPADDGQPLTLQLQVTDLQLLIDQVKLTTSVPEPMSLGILTFAGIGMLSRRRRSL